MILHLGVINIPYSTPVPAEIRRVSTRSSRQGRRRWKDLGKQDHPPAGGETTGDVAQILEDKYHIIESFVEDIGGDKIEEALMHSAENAIENLLMGAPVNKISFADEALSEIEQAFRLFLSLQLMDGMQPGVPTKAALAGVNHRFKHPYAKANAERPSFIDTGTYQTSFKVWVD